jgi:hypothetical protein
VLLSDNSVSQKAVELWEKLGEKNPDLNVTDMRAHVDQWQAAQREKAAQGQKIKEIGMTARKHFQDVTGEEIIIRTFVKVVDRWERRADLLGELGYGAI